MLTYVAVMEYSKYNHNIDGYEHSVKIIYAGDSLGQAKKAIMDDSDIDVIGAKIHIFGGINEHGIYNVDIITTDGDTRLIKNNRMYVFPFIKTKEKE
jgi:hypothetical protein